MLWEELDDCPEVIQSSFLTLKQSARTVLVSRCLISCFEAEGVSSVISFSSERERECYKSKLRFSNSCLER